MTGARIAYSEYMANGVQYTSMDGLSGLKEYMRF